jgi:hypothetical protein
MGKLVGIYCTKIGRAIKYNFDMNICEEINSNKMYFNITLVSIYVKVCLLSYMK